ncbi:hypothetical protein JKP88DRAFT_251889 [Tribonema minus]|uniref:ornithine decarboxylase n=1 Tax=Tribonema minus TaxID=303371 RepID=A0A835ZBZ2_9STRA|nr:hypothetical protein JKP88DRAFT_251889 [Tribonema minus]
MPFLRDAASAAAFVLNCQELHGVLLESIMDPIEPEETSEQDGYTVEMFVKEQEFPPLMINVLSRFGATVTGEAGPIGVKSVAAGIIQNEDLDDTFYIVDLGNTYRLYAAWKSALPEVTPFYAVKCCPEPSIIATLAACGAGFDCASAAEIQLALNEGVGPHRIIFAHPCKRPSDIRFAKNKGVKLTTFDSTNEVNKLAQYYHGCELVLRIRADDPTAMLPLGSKYGANIEEVPELLAEVKKLGMKVVGVSFHVGSGARDPNAFAVAIGLARNVFDQATALGFHMRLLDLGGGFTGRFDSEGNILSMKGALPGAINTAIAKHFPAALIKRSNSTVTSSSLQHQTCASERVFDEALVFLAVAVRALTSKDGKRGVQIIAEPGRYFAEASMHLATHVHGYRLRTEPVDALDRALAEKLQIGPTDEVGMADFVEYWISDGLYGSLNAVIYDQAVPRAWLLPGPSLPPLENPSTLLRSTVFGPTCDSLDVVFRGLKEREFSDEGVVSSVSGPGCDSLDVIVLRDVLLPQLRVGDWMLFPYFGAYTIAGATNFNGIQVRRAYIPDNRNECAASDQSPPQPV